MCDGDTWLLILVYITLGLKYILFSKVILYVVTFKYRKTAVYLQYNFNFDIFYNSIL